MAPYPCAASGFYWRMAVGRRSGIAGKGVSFLQTSAGSAWRWCVQKHFIKSAVGVAAGSASQPLLLFSRKRHLKSNAKTAAKTLKSFVGNELQ